MKRSNWQLWAVLAALFLTLAGTAVWGMATSRERGSLDMTGVLFVAAWSILAACYSRMYVLDPNGRLVGSYSLGGRVTAPDSQNEVLLTGMNAGRGLLGVAASNRLVVFR
jgi:hypothetical protein